MKFPGLLAITLAAVPFARAQTHLRVALDATQESPAGGGRTGSGMGSLTLSAPTLTFTSVNFCGLSADAAAVRIHGPAQAGSKAGLLYDVGGITTIGQGSGTISGNLTLLEGQGGYSLAQQVEQLAGGLWYVSVATSAFTGGEIRGQIVPSRPAKILAVVRDRDGDPVNGVNMNDSDDPWYLARLTTVLGHEVVVLGNSPGQVASPDDWKTHGPVDMVLISGSVRVADVAAAYRECPVPVLYAEAGISAPQSLADDAAGQSGVVSGQTDLVITNPGHPLAGGFCGRVSVFSGAGPGRMNFLTPNPHMISVAAVAGNEAQAVISAYKKGVCMFDGLPAPARRVNLFMPETDTATALDNGWALFDASVAWCLSTPPLPQITMLTPANGAVFAPAANGISFRASSSEPIAAGGITMTLNGFDETANLVISGSPNDRTLTFNGLLPNKIYTARVTVSNAPGTQTAYLDFDTLTESEAKIIEAEDYDYDGGHYQVSPPPSGFDAQCVRIPANPSAGYAAQTGIPEVDYFDTQTGGGAAATCPYRPFDFTATRQTFDVTRSKYTAAMVSDYHLKGIADTEWWKYTSEFSPRSCNVYLRASRIAPAQVRLDKRDAVTGDLHPQGTFFIPDTQNSGFSYVPLMDGAGHQVTVNFSGATDTLRLAAVASHPSLYLNYLLLVNSSVPLLPSPPVIENVRRNGNNFEFSFATASGRRYSVQYTDSLSQPGTWKTLTTFSGTGLPHNVSDPVAGLSQRFYRVGDY